MIRSITDTRRTTACMALLSLCVGLYLSNARASSPIAFDVDLAIGICDSSALDNLEGIWIYPDDNVTVTVFRNDSRQQYSLPEYDITVVHSPDCSLSPGERIGRISATHDVRRFDVELYTERKGLSFMKPKNCSGTLSSEGDMLTLRHDAPRFRLRLNLNPTTLLPRLWKSMLRISGSTRDGNDNSTSGMIKIYPSYDGNGSSRLQPRYL